MTKRGFTPVVVGGTKATDVAEPPAVLDPSVPKYKEGILKMLEVIREAVESNDVTGLVSIIIFKDGRQSENALSEENAYALMGRIHALAGNVNLKTFSVEEENDAEAEANGEFDE